MNQDIASLPSVFLLVVILSGGNAPARWKRGLARKTARLTAVRRSTAWTKKFGVAYPKLREGPLLGQTLKVLAGSADLMQEAQPLATQREKTRFTRRDSVLERKQGIVSHFRDRASIKTAATGRLAVTELTSDSAKDLSRVNTQADRLLLSRLAGDKLILEEKEQREARPYPVRRKLDMASMAAEPVQTSSLLASRTRSDVLFAPVDRDFGTQQDWLSGLAHRAGKVLDWKKPEVAGIAKYRKDELQALDQAPSLTEQWTIPLGGVCASLDMLHRLATPENSPRGIESGETGRHITRSQQSPLEKYKTLSPGEFWRPREETIPPAGNTFVKPYVNGPTQPAQPTQSDQPGERELEHLVPVVSPNPAPSLPSLLPPQGVGMRTLPVAATTARQAAREEAALGTDDLGALADKIKLILDEQARRHGIDV
jgi:hypothetical protein